MTDDVRTFALKVDQMVEKAKGKIDTVMRKSILDLGTRLVELSPVGNPDLWKVNKAAASYNAEVARWNSSLRDTSENLTKSGRLKRGLKVHDSMDIKKQAGYSGGRFRANWDLSINSVSNNTFDVVDKSGGASIARIGAKVTSGNAGDTFYIVNSLPYARKLEYEGHSKQVPAAGIVGTVVVEFSGILEAAARSVK